MDSLTLRIVRPSSNAKAVFAEESSVVTRPDQDATLILSLAQSLESSYSRRVRWYLEDRIESLDGQTAAELVAAGHGQRVLRFLHRCVWSEATRFEVY